MRRLFTVSLIRSAGLSSSLLLSSKTNILAFLEKTVNIQDRQFEKAREDLLKFLHEYIKFLGRRVQDYALDIRVRGLPFSDFPHHPT